MKKIYLDYAATTPVDIAVADAMKPYFMEQFGNPGSLHSFGQAAIKALDESRETISKALGAQFRDVIFTGSATEANNLTLRGVVSRLRSIGAGRPLAPAASGDLHSPQPHSAESGGRAAAGSESRHTSANEKPRIIVSSIEHESILETCRDLEREGVEVVYVPVDENGIVDREKLKQALNERTVLVSVMYANNELGTIQPISEIAQIIRDFREQIANSKSQMGKKNHKPLAISHWPLFHTDAVQAFQFLDCTVDALGVDLMTISAHKIYGPKGVGALYIREKRTEKREKYVEHDSFSFSAFPFLCPLIIGGGQEFGLRSGTENVPAVVGFAKAVELVLQNREREAERVGQLCDQLWKGIKRIHPLAQTNADYTQTSAEGGPRESASRQRTSACLPNILNVYFPRMSSQDLLVQLDLAGVAVSAGSACAARSTKPSSVLKACGFSLERVNSSLRFSLGKYTTEAEIQEVLKRLGKILKSTNS